MKQSLKGFLKSNTPPLYSLACQFRAFTKGQVRFRELDAYLRTDDRTLLEESILPYFADRPDLLKVLFVGYEWYTKLYKNIFNNKEYWTLDLDPFNARYGSRKHIVGTLETLDSYCNENYFDLIIANGIVGDGLNTKEAAEVAFQQCWRCLRPEGILLLGWNDVPEFRPFCLEEIRSLKQFAPYSFSPFSSARYSTQTRLKHVFSFFSKPVKFEQHQKAEADVVKGIV
jgi:SAM-dependent methyltransferase